MRRFALIACGLVIAFWAQPVHAESSDDYLQAVVNGLKDANVYVAPGTPGTDGDTASKLESKLKGGDGIELAMLPPDAATSITKPQDFVQQLSVKLGNDDIIGLTIGDHAYAYSAVLPKTIASDLMDKAGSVSATSADTLDTFVVYTHQWEADHPHEVAVPAAHGGGGFPWLTTLIILVALAAAGGVIGRRQLAKQSAPDRVLLKRSPDQVKSYLEEILNLRKRVRDYDLQEVLRSCCIDTERYFAHNSSDRKADAIVFESHLESVVEVLRKYLDIQESPRYYDNPADELESGKTGIKGFADYVLRSCRNGSRAELTRYKVNTQILDAQRFG